MSNSLERRSISWSVSLAASELGINSHLGSFALENLDSSSVNQSRTKFSMKSPLISGSMSYITSETNGSSIPSFLRDSSYCFMMSSAIFWICPALWALLYPAGSHRSSTRETRSKIKRAAPTGPDDPALSADFITLLRTAFPSSFPASTPSFVPNFLPNAIPIFCPAFLPVLSASFLDILPAVLAIGPDNFLIFVNIFRDLAIFAAAVPTLLANFFPNLSINAAPSGEANNIIAISSASNLPTSSNGKPAPIGSHLQHKIPWEFTSRMYPSLHDGLSQSTDPSSHGLFEQVFSFNLWSMARSTVSIAVNITCSSHWSKSDIAKIIRSCGWSVSESPEPNTVNSSLVVAFTTSLSYISVPSNEELSSTSKWGNIRDGRSPSTKSAKEIILVGYEILVMLMSGRSLNGVEMTFCMTSVYIDVYWSLILPSNKWRTSEIDPSTSENLSYAVSMIPAYIVEKSCIFLLATSSYIFWNWSCSSLYFCSKSHSLELLLLLVSNPLVAISFLMLFNKIPLRAL